MTRAVTLSLIVLVAAIPFAVRPAAHDPVTTKVTWSREIAPIVSRRCAGCHRPGGPAPMSLASYDDAKPWARAMRAEVVAGRMPRWAAVRGFGHFANDRSVSPFEIALMSAWAGGGAPEGDSVPPDPLWSPSPAVDTTVRLPRRAGEPAGDTVTFQTDLATRRNLWITGWRFFANDPAIVQAEFSFADGTYLGNWVPPETMVQLPAGVALAWPPDTGLSVTVWYREQRLQQDFPVGLPSLPPVLALATDPRVPPHRRKTRDVACGDTDLVEGGSILAVRPVAAGSGDAVSVALERVDAPPVPILRIRDFDPGHLETYRLHEPVEIPVGSRMLVRSTSGNCRVQLDTIN